MLAGDMEMRRKLPGAKPTGNITALGPDTLTMGSSVNPALTKHYALMDSDRSCPEHGRTRTGALDGSPGLRNVSTM